LREIALATARIWVGWSSTRHLCVRRAIDAVTYDALPDAKRPIQVQFSRLWEENP
jgi:hypothetical protein